MHVCVCMYWCAHVRRQIRVIMTKFNSSFVNIFANTHTCACVCVSVFVDMHKCTYKYVYSKIVTVYIGLGSIGGHTRCKFYKNYLHTYIEYLKMHCRTASYNREVHTRR